MARPRAARRDAFALSEAQPVTTLVEQAHVELHYDYEQLPAAQRARAIQAAQTIKPRLKRAAEDIFVIGAELNQVKAAFPHGEFGNWLGAEFGLSQRMAQHFMNVATRLLDKSEKFSLLPPSSLYLLAAPTTPDQAIVEIEQKLDAGERLQARQVTRIVTLVREQLAPETPPTRPELDDEDRARAERLERRLAKIANQLGGRTGRDWRLLFDDRRLAHAQREVVALLEAVQGLLHDAEPGPDADDAPDRDPA